jgi:hypothetical protein
MVSKGNHPKMALIQVSELLSFAQMYVYVMENPNLKWMLTGGTPISGNLHLEEMSHLRLAITTLTVGDET